MAEPTREPRPDQTSAESDIQKAADIVLDHLKNNRITPPKAKAIRDAAERSISDQSVIGGIGRTSRLGLS